MSRYIDAEQAVNYLLEHKRLGLASNIVLRTNEDGIIKFINEKCPTADVAEVRHGRNVTDMHPVDEFICSECGLILRDLTETRIDEENEDECYFEFECKYCPNCGARMDKGEA